MAQEKRKRGVVDRRGRITFRVDVETAAKFKAIAVIKRMKLDELGRKAIEDMIKKEKTVLKDFLGD